MSRILLPATLLILASCDRQPDALPPPRPAPAVKAADPACPLPLHHFSLKGHYELTGSRLGVPTDHVGIDKAGRLSWNHRPVSAQRVAAFLQAFAANLASSPPYFLLIQADPNAPCATIREILSAAIRIGRCRPDVCTLELPERQRPPRPSPRT